MKFKVQPFCTTLFVETLRPKAFANWLRVENKAILCLISESNAPTYLSGISQSFVRTVDRLCAAGGGNHSAVRLHTGLGVAGADWRCVDGSRMVDFKNVQHMEVTVWL